ncbi:MAG: hypothetical protein WBA13_16750 [Microcoleaceae cyanobacterium]
MQPDLIGLEINRGEIKGLTGVNVKQIHQPAIAKNFIQEGVKTFSISLLVLLSYLILALVFPGYRQLLAIIHGLLVGGLILEDCYKIILSIKHRNLIRILDSINQYNAIIKAINLNDELESVGNSHIKFNNRPQIISAMKLVREDLIRAMKSERILRKNKKLLAHHDHLFATNLTALTGLQISNRSTQQGRILNEALQIVTDVQAELQHIQNQSLELGKANKQ